MWRNIENDEYLNIIVNDIVNDDSVYLNNARNHTIENDIENDDFVVAIQQENKVNANKKHLSYVSSLDEEKGAACSWF